MLLEQPERGVMPHHFRVLSESTVCTAALCDSAVNHHTVIDHRIYTSHTCNRIIRIYVSHVKVKRAGFLMEEKLDQYLSKSLNAYKIGRMVLN